MTRHDLPLRLLTLHHLHTHFIDVIASLASLATTLIMMMKMKMKMMMTTIIHYADHFR